MANLWFNTEETAVCWFKNLKGKWFMFLFPYIPRDWDRSRGHLSFIENRNLNVTIIWMRMIEWELLKSRKHLDFVSLDGSLWPNLAELSKIAMWAFSLQRTMLDKVWSLEVKKYFRVLCHRIDGGETELRQR